MSLIQVLILVAVISYTKAALTIDPALCKLDLVLCLDNTGSIAYLSDGSLDSANPPANWKSVIKFSQDLVDPLTVSPTGSQVGLVDFGGEARIQFGLTQYPTKSEVVAAIGKLPFIGDTTNTSGALFKSRTVLTDPRYGSRDGKAKNIVLITDGNPTVAADTVLAEAQNCRDAGIRVIVVGITSYADEELMRQIAYTPNDYVYAEDFSDLDGIKNVVLNDQSCKPIPPKVTTVAPPATTASPKPTEPPVIEC